MKRTRRNRSVGSLTIDAELQEAFLAEAKASEVNGQEMSRSTRIEKKFVRCAEGTRMYSMSPNSFMRLANEANAVYRHGRMTLINVRILDEYLDTFRC